MKNIFSIHIILFVLLLSYAQNLAAQNNSPADTFPVPAFNAYELFYLQRQPNTNTIVVALNVEDGKLNLDNPVLVYWIRFAEKGQREELNWIQRTFAYGIHSKTISHNVYELNFVSYKKMKFWLEKGPDNIWQVFVNIGEGKKMILNRIYLHIEGGTFWNPDIKYAELKGKMPGTGQEVRQRIQID